MSETDRNRLVALKKVMDKVMTQKEASMELGVSVRQVKRLVRALRQARRQSGVAWRTRETVEPSNR